MSWQLSVLAHLDSRALGEAVSAAGTGSLVWSSFQNLDGLIELLGAPAATTLRHRARAELARVGPTFDAGDSDFVTIATTNVGATSDDLRPLSWLVHALHGVTEAWQLRANGKTLEGLVPRRLMEISTGLRFGVVPLEAADLPACLGNARDMSEKQKLDKRGITRFGFPALWPDRFRTLTQIADPSCPSCAARPTVLETRPDQSTLEKCPGCELEVERALVWLIGGRQVGLGHT